MLNKPYKTLLATLVLATGLSVVPASTVQAEVVHIVLDDGTEADVERSEIHEYIAQHYRDIEDAERAAEDAERAAEDARIKAKNMKAFKHIVVSHKADKLPNVSLSASEKKGILTVKTGNLEEAVKLHKLLVSKKYKELRVKASSQKDADKILDKLSANLGIANTYGLNLLFSNFDGMFGLDKKGSYYYYNDYFDTSKSGLRKSAKMMNSQYYYAMKVMKHVWDSYKKCFESYGYELPSNTYFCDLSEVARAYAVPLIIGRVHDYDYSRYSPDPLTKEEYNYYHKNHPKKGLGDWQILAGNKRYTDYVCMHFARAAELLGASLGLDVEYRDSEKLNHAWVICKVKNCLGKTIKLRSDNGGHLHNNFNYGEDKLLDLNLLEDIGVSAELYKLDIM